MPVSQPDVILIRGAPGVGKTQLSKMLKRYYPEGVTVEVDGIRSMIHEHKQTNLTEYKYGLTLCGIVCSSYLSNKYRPVIIIDSFGTPFLKDFLKSMAALTKDNKGWDYKVITLYCDDEELEQRILNRKNGFSDMRIVRIVNDDMRKNRHQNEHFTDTTGKTPEDVLKLVVSTLMTHVHC